MTKEQLQKHLWQHSAGEHKEIGLLFRKSLKSQDMTTPVQIHTLKIAAQLGKSPVAQVRVVKTKPITKKQVKKNLQRHDCKEQKEIALELLEGVPEE